MLIRLLDYWKLNYYLLEDNCHILEGNNTIPKTFKEFEAKEEEKTITIKVYTKI